MNYTKYIKSVVKFATLMSATILVACSGSTGNCPPSTTVGITLSPESVIFTKSSAIKTIGVSNAGSSSLTLTTLPTLASPLTLESTLTTCAAGVSLVPAESCVYVITVDYSVPVTAGSTTLAFDYYDGTSFTANLSVAWSNVYAYFVNNTTFGYTQCSVNASGAIESTTCLSIGSLLGAGTYASITGIAFNGGYAYLVNTSSYSYIQCSVNTNGIESTTCTNLTPAAPGELDSPITIAFNGNYVYFTNAGNNSYTQCSVGTSGIESATCVTTIPQVAGSNVLSSPSGIAFNGSYAYIVNTDNDSYTQCSVGSNGIIESATCVITTPVTLGALSSSMGIAFNGGYAYFVNGGSSGSSYTQCSVNASGIDSTTCVTTAPTGVGGLDSPFGIAFNRNYAYIANNGSNSNYTQCSVNASGIESATCVSITPAAPGDLANPFGIAFN